jgi:Ras-related protein Rab-28
MSKKHQDLKKEIVQSDSSDGEPENLQYKVVVLGNGTVGKTSTIMRFCEDYFAKSYKQTIGVDFFVKRLEMPGNVYVALQVWDIGGQSIFGKMIETYIYEANAVTIKTLNILLIFITHYR